MKNLQQKFAATELKSSDAQKIAQIVPTLVEQVADLQKLIDEEVQSLRVLRPKKPLGAGFDDDSSSPSAMKSIVAQYDQEEAAWEAFKKFSTEAAELKEACATRVKDLERAVARVAEQNRIMNSASRVAFVKGCSAESLAG